MFFKLTARRAIFTVILISILGFSLQNPDSSQLGGVQPGFASEPPSASTTYYLPTLINRYPWKNPFGVEPIARLSQGSTLYNRVLALHLGWVRLNGRISWRTLQPVEGGPIQWSLLADFENELRALKAANLTPIVIADDYPYWAVDIVRNDRQPTSCGPIRADKFAAYAAFLRALVARYKSSEFNVHHWELGNEPDVDPDLVDIDSQFGCWGDINDPYYGGRHYGSMLNTVTPAIKAEDPWAKVWIGGLLLASPATTNPNLGHPERFLQGILLSGAASNFDIVPYHWYPSYFQAKVDYDLAQGTEWEPWGGGTVGKARFLRQVLQAGGVTKLISLNETGLGCPNDWTIYPWCQPPGPDAQFFQIQADYLVRSFTRGLNEDVASLLWYTLDAPGWRHTSLLDISQNPKPVYQAYQTLTSQLQNTRKHGPVSYDPRVEAYAFQRGQEHIQVVWTITDTSVDILIPQANFLAAYSRDGVPLQPILQGADYLISVGFSPIYLVLRP